MLRIISIIIFICLAINKPALADSACRNPVFGYSGIKIDESAETANAAQQKSFAKAHRDAFSVVLNRVLIGDTADFSELTPETFVELVHIRTENSLPGRYIAEIDICFSPQALQALFIENDLQWAEIASPPVLVLPVFEDGAGIRAWQNPHPWLTPWIAAADQSNGLIDYVTLENTLQNERQLRAEKLFAADTDMIKSAAERAKAEQVLWTRAVISLVDDAPQLDMQANIFDKNGALIAPVLDSIIQGDEALNTANFDVFLNDVLALMETGWQQANLRQANADNQLIARILFKDHQDWIAKQIALSKLPAINRIATLSLRTSTKDDDGNTVSEAIISLEMNGSVDALRYGLAPLGLSLFTSGDIAVIK